jgi:pimeloyl-ACP methyl ester carboxylesterase
MSAIVIDGGLVHYESMGRGKPLLFLHGWLGSWRYWMSTMQVMADQYRTYALDFWGFGDSDKTKVRYSVLDYVTLIDNFVSALGIERFSLVGHSLGATVMLEYALHRPERIDKLMAISLPMSLACVNRKLLNISDNSMMAKLLWWRQQAIHEEVLAETQKTDQRAITTSLQSMGQMNINHCLKRIDRLAGPLMLAVYGEKDDVIDPGPMRQMNGHWPHIRPMGLAQSKHFPMLDEASRFHRLLKDFLDLEQSLAALELKEEWRRRTR